MQIPILLVHEMEGQNSNIIAQMKQLPGGSSRVRNRTRKENSLMEGERKLRKSGKIRTAKNTFPPSSFLFLRLECHIPLIVPQDKDGRERERRRGCVGVGGGGEGGGGEVIPPKLHLNVSVGRRGRRRRLLWSAESEWEVPPTAKTKGA